MGAVSPEDMSTRGDCERQGMDCWHLLTGIGEKATG